MNSLIRATLAMFILLAAACGVLAQEQTPAPAPEAPAAPAQPLPTPSGPTEVTVGVYINDIQQLDLQSHSYVMDFYVWFRWQNPDINPQTSLEFMNPYQLWGHINTPLYETPQDLPDGWKYAAIRYQGQFNTKLPLEKYPFDTQKLVIEFEDNSAGSNGLRFIPDKDAVTINPELTLPGYVLGNPQLVIRDKPYPTNFGDTRLTELEPYSRVSVTVPVNRPWFTYAIKIILPILLVAATAALVYFIHPTFVEARIGLGITALLTLVALQLTSNSLLPEVDYLMMIDMLYILAYLFVIASMVQVVRTSWQAQRGDEQLAIAHDRASFKMVASVYVLATIGVMAWYLLA